MNLSPYLTVNVWYVIFVNHGPWTALFKDFHEGFQMKDFVKEAVDRNEWQFADPDNEVGEDLFSL